MSCVQATFVELVAKLVNNGEITGVSDVRDESDRDGMRVVVELRRGANAEVVVNNLYKQTNLQTTFPCNMVALVDKTPQTLNLKQFLEHFLDFRSVWHCSHCFTYTSPVSATALHTHAHRALYTLCNTAQSKSVIVDHCGGAPALCMRPDRLICHLRCVFLCC